MEGQDLLSDQRRRIDEIDEAIVALLARRMTVVQEVIGLKHEAGLPANLPDRVEAVVARVRAAAAPTDCPADLAEAVWRTIISWTIAYEERSLLPRAP